VTFFYDPLRRFFEAHAFPAQNGGITVFGRDVTEQHRAEEALRRLAYSDALTGLANRTRLRELLGLAMVRPAPAALLLLDLDGFKHVNDSMGHGAGDVVLRDVATRLASRLGDRGTLARLGADEFAMLLPGVDSAAEAEAIAGELLAALAADPFRTGGRMFHIGASIGLVFVPLGFGTDPDVVMANADLALFRAKAVGGGACQTFDTGIRQEYEVRRLLEEDIGRAVASGEFELHYQPQVRLADGALVGAEALLRWRHPTRGLLSPSLFLEALETSPHACAVGYWIIDEACQQAAAWRADGLTLRIGINLFGEQLRAGGLAEKIEAILARWALPPEMLELELTENIALRHEQGMLAPLRILRARGVGIAFDDFGTGFASLTMLKDFPLTRLKIDRGFIASLPEGAHDAAIVDALLALGRNLSLEVIAEGIETAAQAEFLAARGCSEGQGYLFSRPLPPEAFTVAFSPRGSHAGMVEFSWARGG
jgi:diguanylate cyclase (GGDEF)-like protein